MKQKLDFKKEYKDLYLPAATPVIIDVPPIQYFMVDGVGAPEGACYHEAMQILYSLSYTIKMSKMAGNTPENYRDFVVPPLEGLWDCAAEGFDPDRRRWKWTSMLRQPDFVTPAILEWACTEVRKKKPELDVSKARLALYKEGLCVQIMHIGPYSAEQRSIDKVMAFIRENGLVDQCGTERKHHEIYISDPRKTNPETLKTVLRHPVSRK